MVTREQIARINELYKKRKEVGLSEEEKIEEQQLRDLYVKSFRENLKSQLKNIKVVSPEEYAKYKAESKCSCGHDHGEHHHSHGENCGCKEHKH